MRLFFAVHNVYTDHRIGAARSLRTMLEWLTSAGHDCQVLATARFEAAQDPDIEAHLRSLNVPMERRLAATRAVGKGRKSAQIAVGRPMVSFVYNGVPVTTLLTRHNDLRQPDKSECAQLMALFDEKLHAFRPDLLFTYGDHFMTLEFMKRARQRGVKTVYSVRNLGYESPAWFQHADHTLANSPYLSRYYEAKIGLKSVGIPSPIEWADVLAPETDRKFVTMVNPAPHKGGALFARLAYTLGVRRPDIPILTLLPFGNAQAFQNLPGMDFSRFPQIMAAPPVPRPADFFALTKILLVPSVFNEPFGRVAAEALINGVPPIVSDRGALPETVGDAGVVLPLPDSLLDESAICIPTEAEVEPWFQAVVTLWDNNNLYAEASQKARETGERLYSEAMLKARYLAYFEACLNEKAVQ